MIVRDTDNFSPLYSTKADLEIIPNLLFLFLRNPESHRNRGGKCRCTIFTLG